MAKDGGQQHKQPEAFVDRGRGRARSSRGGRPGAQGALDEDVDAILDEIDDVLETNAEDFVQRFVQKGGQ